MCDILVSHLGPEKTRSFTQIHFDGNENFFFPPFTQPSHLQDDNGLREGIIQKQTFPVGMTDTFVTTIGSLNTIPMSGAGSFITRFLPFVTIFSTIAQLTLTPVGLLNEYTLPEETGT